MVLTFSRGKIFFFFVKLIKIKAGKFFDAMNKKSRRNPHLSSPQGQIIEPVEGLSFFQDFYAFGIFMRKYNN